MSITDDAGESVEESLRRARDLLAAGDARGALDAANDPLKRGLRPIAGLHLLRAMAFLRLNAQIDALYALEGELVVDPASADGAARLAEVKQWLRDTRYAPPHAPAPREWGTLLPQHLVDVFEHASHLYTYRGMPMVKNPFDLAIYPLLLSRIKPASIIEVGTLYGGSAVWLADMTRAMGLPTRIWSIDVFGMPLLEDERVTFMQGSGRELGVVLSEDFLRDLPRPLLVIEDADHQHPTTLAVLKFFHPHLRSGEYIVVEDGMSAAGPRTGVAEFLASHGGDYEIDPDYCDFYGPNVTWCVNGFLRRR